MAESNGSAAISTTADSPFLAGHFQDLSRQAHAARMGMWIFLGTEVLLFGGLFVSYVFYRYLFPESFRAASSVLDAVVGAADTAVLLTSSLTAVLSLHFLRAGQPRRVTAMLAATMLLGAAFLVMHGFEYRHDVHEGNLPGRYLSNPELLPWMGANLFFALYFLMTGLHSLHVVAGVSILGWMLVRNVTGRLSAAWDAPLEVATLYWHLVDVIWIFLFPLLYLV